VKSASRNIPRHNPSVENFDSSSDDGPDPRDPMLSVKYPFMDLSEIEQAVNDRNAAPHFLAYAARMSAECKLISVVYHPNTSTATLRYLAFERRGPQMNIVHDAANEQLKNAKRERMNPNSRRRIRPNVKPRIMLN